MKYVYFFYEVYCYPYFTMQDDEDRNESSWKRRAHDSEAEEDIDEDESSNRRRNWNPEDSSDEASAKRRR